MSGEVEGEGGRGEVVGKEDEERPPRYV